MELKLPPLAETGETLTGAEIAIRCLQEEGVEFVFGYPGGAVLFIYDALFKQKKVKHILVRHEQGALHAADGYARATGRPGVALVTSGPGVTNAVTGIATAYMDSIPMVVITGQVPTRAIGEDAFQECDTVGITRPCVKHNFLVKDVNELAVTIKKAFHIATTGRPGPVLVDIPKDVSQQTARFHYPDKIHLRSYSPVMKGHGGQINPLQRRSHVIDRGQRHAAAAYFAGLGGVGVFAGAGGGVEQQVDGRLPVFQVEAQGAVEGRRAAVGQLLGDEPGLWAGRLIAAGVGGRAG